MSKAKETLDAIRKKHKGDIPPLPYLPIGEVVVVYRLPSETHTAGGLEIPEEYRAPLSRGVLVAAGLQARDMMTDNLIDVGDIVYFARFAGDEKEFKRDEAQKGQQLLQLKARELLGTADGLWRIENYDIVRVENEDGTNEYMYRLKQGKEAA